MRHWLKLVAFFSVAVATIAPLSATEFDSAKLGKIRERMQGFVDQKVIAGAVTVVGSKDGIASLEAVGLQKIETKQPMPKDALFRIASMTKPITAMGIMILQEEGKLSVDDPVEKHLPEFRGQRLTASREGDTVTLKKPSRAITLRDLLTHTSGLPGGFPPGLADLYATRQRTLAEAVLVSSQQPLDFEPGSKWAYCNAGIDTLGRVIEVVSGQSFEEFMAARVFRPLGMQDTACFPTEQNTPRIAGLYESKNSELVVANRPIVGPATGAKHPIPAGGLYSTAADLAKLYQAMLNAGRLGSKKIISPESVLTMTKVQTGDLQCGFTPGMGFGYGWAVVKEPQGVTAMVSPGTYGHGGAFGTQAWIDPKQDLFVVLLIQRVGLPNADGSDLRRELQQLAIEAIKN
ncbi:MAG: beta-lactamase family protein [Planctomycetaceae bacterium]|nr:beta-lactamase family protein [Planctomycetaceae bacterium]